MIKFGMMSTTEVRHSYSLNHLINVFPPVRKYLFSGIALQKTIYFYIQQCHRFALKDFFGIDFFGIQRIRTMLAFLG